MGRTWKDKELANVKALSAFTQRGDEINRENICEYRRLYGAMLESNGCRTRDYIRPFRFDSPRANVTASPIHKYS
jgi:hypothetical protein